MSSRRSRQSGTPTIKDDQIIELVSKLRQLVPEIRDRRSDKVTKLLFLSYIIYLLEYNKWVSTCEKCMPFVECD